MSYQVLARKWRPQTFVEMAGQDHVLQALVNALRQQRLHHAYLFTGTRGVGKTTVARIFAKCLNCETNGISPEPCGQCPSCREIAEGRFVDLIEVDAASRTKVEDTRELLENVQYAPTRGRFKVYLIDEVHMLSSHSFNALLKTLEEPPEHVKFLLATTDPQKLPVTILSRCLQFNLKNMSAERVVNYLTHLLSEEKVSFDEPALWQIGQAANGSMRDALSLTDQAIAFGDGTVTESGVTSMLGLVNQAQVLMLLEVLLAGDAAGVLKKVQELADYQPDFAMICASMLDILHRIAIEQQVPGALGNSLGDLPRIQALASQTAPDEIQLCYQSLLIGRRDLPLAHNPRAGFEMLLLRVLAFRPAPPVAVSFEPAVYEPPVVPANSANREAASEPAVSSVPAMKADVGELAGPDKAEEQLERTAQVSPSQDRQSSKEGIHSEPHVETEMAKSTPEMVEETDSANQDVPPPWDYEPVVESEVHNQSESAMGSDNLVTLNAQEGSLPEASSAQGSALDVGNTEESAEENLVLDEPVSERSTHQGKSESFAEEFAAADDESDEVDTTSVMADLSAFLSSDETDNAGDTPVENQKPVVADSRRPDAIAQPALGMELPKMAHFSELDMQRWWLVAPRLPLTGLVHNILMNSCLVEASQQGIQLEVPLEYGHMLNQTRYEQIQQALSEFFEVNVPLIMNTVENVNGVTAEEFAAGKRAEALQAAIDHLKAHPIVMSLSNTMEGQLVYESVKVKS